MIKVFSSLAICFVAIFGMASPVNASSSPLTNVAATCQGGLGNVLGLRTWDSCLQHNSDGNPKITSIMDVWLIVLPLLEDAIKIAGYAAAGFVIWGGVKYIKSQGEPGEIANAQKVIWNALLGFVLAMMSVAIVQFVANAL